MQIKFLGTSDSGGIPSHNCECTICEEYRALNKINLATCAYIKCKNDEIILLDAGIEAISNIFDKKKIAAIFLTHFHPDHVLGLLRLRYSKDIIPCYHPKDEKGFSDLFKHKKSIDYKENFPFIPIYVNNISFTPLPLQHSKNTTGYLIESENKKIAYLSDCAGIDQKVLKFLKTKNVDECYIDACLAPGFNNGNHLNFEEAADILDQIGAKSSHLIHTSHYTLEYIKKNHITLRYDYIFPE